MVHSVRAVLAAGSGGARAVSDGLGHPFTIPYRRNCGAQSFSSGVGDHSLPGKIAEYPIARLTIA
jgi:hypothetical protein